MALPLLHIITRETNGLGVPVCVCVCGWVFVSLTAVCGTSSEFSTQPAKCNKWLFIGVTAQSLLPPRASIRLPEQGSSQEPSAHPHVSPFLHTTFIFFPFPSFNWRRLSCPIFKFWIWHRRLAGVFLFFLFPGRCPFSAPHPQRPKRNLCRARMDTRAQRVEGG